jgi:uncharacterized protein (TIGR00730 family)
MPRPIARVCVFCGSSDGRRPAFARAARAVGALLAGEGIGVVYGGGRVGLMGALADAALAAGGEVIGVIPQLLIAKERGHPGITELRVVQTMHQRKAMMADLADAFLALPGGLGTLEEICEVVTLAQLGIHAKPCAVLNVGGYFDSLLAFLDHAAAEGLIRPENRALLMHDDDPARLLGRMREWQPPAGPHWLDAGQR